MPTEFAPRLSLLDWRGELTLFRDKFSTRPARMYRELTWNEVVALIAPKGGPIVGDFKDRLPYFLPCLLRPDVPLVGLTRMRAEAKGLALVGAMRSAAHVTCASWIVFDLDGIRRQEIIDVARTLENEQMAFLLFTTFSHGVQGKGTRLRAVLPLDLPLSPRDYGSFHHSLNREYFGGRADETGARLSQQQGVWGCPEERSERAFRLVFKGSPVRVGEISSSPVPGSRRSILPTTTTQPNDEITALPVEGLPTIRRLREACAFLVADNYATWAKGLTAFAALALPLGREEVTALALQFAATSPEDTTRMKNASDPCYDPRQFLERVRPEMTPQQAARCLLARACDRAIAVVERHRGKTEGSEAGKEAARYLAVNHPSIWRRYEREGRQG